MPRQMPTTLRLHFRAQARGGSLLLTFPIGSRGSRHRRPLPDRPPTLQAFQSVLSRTRHSPSARLSPRPFGLGPQSKAFRRLPTSFNPRLSWLPFVPPSPRSSIPGSTDIIPYSFVGSLSEILFGKIVHRRWSGLRTANNKLCAVHKNKGEV